jgi:tRNA(fMet)-specific endonuclease VapC
VSPLVVDTSVVSYLFKNHSLAPQYRDVLEGKLLGISFMSLGELYRWPLERNWGDVRIKALQRHLHSYVVLPSDESVCWAWARIMAQKGRPTDSADAWIAATALRHASPLVTHNTKHFRHIQGLELLTVPG